MPASFLENNVNTMKKLFFLGVLALSFAFASCTPNSFGAYDHVVIIGVDGAGAFFSDTVTPITAGIFKDAASTHEMVTSMPTSSAECWTSMMHGVLPDVHGISNAIAKANIYPLDSPYPSFFQIARDSDPDAKLASFCHWNPINHGIVESNIGVVEGTGEDEEVTEQILSYLKDNDPKIMFVQFDSVDGAGHKNGYGTEAYLQALTAVDVLIGQIYDALKSKGILRKTLFIVTADHGGTPEGGHGGDTPAERLVYFGACGRTITGQSAVKDSEFRDIPSIVVYALGLEPAPTWTGSIPAGVFPDVVGE